jgi:hypothetical protein
MDNNDKKITASEIFAALGVIAFGHAFGSYLFAKRFHNALDPFIAKSVTIKDIIPFAEDIQFLLCICALIPSLMVILLYINGAHNKCFDKIILYFNDFKNIVLEFFASHNKIKVFFQKLSNFIPELISHKMSACSRKFIDYILEHLAKRKIDVAIISALVIFICAISLANPYLRFIVISICCIFFIMILNRLNTLAMFVLLYFYFVFIGVTYFITSDKYYTDGNKIYTTERYLIITTNDNEKILKASNIERLGDFLNVRVDGKEKLIGISSIYSIEEIPKSKGQ